MEIYQYLSSLINVLLALSSLYSVKIITLNSLHKGYCFIYVLLYSLSVYLINLELIVSYILIISFVLIFNYFISKNHFIINSILFLFFYYSISIFLTLLSPSITIINGVLMLTSYKGLLASLFIPLFGLIMLFSSMLVDKTFHLHNFQDTIYLTIGNKTMELKGYYDTGNTLTYKNIPVIFLSDCNYIFSNDEFNEETSFETVLQDGKTKLAKGLISLKGRKDEYFVYVATGSKKTSYHGCELLLNAYLF